MTHMNKIITTDITDPFLNLAIENDLLLKTSKNQRHLFTFINRPCVVIGRFQNPWLECNIKKMYKAQIPLLRRQSGGGTVYHDQNNVNFSFIADKKIHSQKINHQIIIEALDIIKVKAYATARGDIRLLDQTDRKISGSAFKQKKDQAFHHGTMLINTDLEKLNAFIRSDKQDFISKSIASVRSKVANIREIDNCANQENFIKSLIDTFKKSHGPFEEIFISRDDVLSKDILNYADTLRSYEWKVSETPKFTCTSTIKTHEGNVSIEAVIRKTKIESIEFSSTEVHPLLLDEMERIFLNQKIVMSEIENLALTYKGISSQFMNDILIWFKEYFYLDILTSL